MFFKIIGMLVVGFFVFVFLLGFFGKFWIRSKLGKMIKEANEMGPAGNPFEVEQRVNISLVKREAYSPSQAASQLSEQLRQNNFSLLNWYEIPEMQETNILGAHRDDFFVIIYDKQNTAYFELLAETLNEEIMLLSNAAPDRKMSQYGGVYKKHLPPNTGLDAAIGFLKANVGGTLKPLSRNDFKNLYMRAHAS